MNRLQANLCLLCVTLFWSSEVIIYSCIPEGVRRSLPHVSRRSLARRFLPRRSTAAFSTRTARDLLRYCLVIVVMAVVEDAIVAPAVKLVYPEVDFSFLAAAVFGNTAGFPIVLGIPLSILLQEEMGLKPADARLDQ